MKIAKILAGIAIVMMISGTAPAGKDDNNSIQGQANIEQDGNAWGETVSKRAKSAPSSILNAYDKEKPSSDD
jgi:hypothetical protein